MIRTAKELGPMTNDGRTDDGRRTTEGWTGGRTTDGRTGGRTKFGKNSDEKQKSAGNKNKIKSK